LTVYRQQRKNRSERRRELRHRDGRDSRDSSRTRDRGRDRDYDRHDVSCTPGCLHLLVLEIFDTGKVTKKAF